MKTVAISQSNYIPWKGYFDLIARVDEFILYDEMQYTRRDWRNRNQIKTPQGVQWLTVPVKVKGKYEQSIRETEIDGSQWATQHWKTITLNYRRAPFFSEYAPRFEQLYAVPYRTISELNRVFIEEICRILGITTKISNCWEYPQVEGRTERLVGLCQQVHATEYISGPAAQDYIQRELFNNAGVNLTWFSYDGYPAYSQLWGDFTHAVSIIDLIFNCGPAAPNYMRFVRP